MLKIQNPIAVTQRSKLLAQVMIYKKKNFGACSMKYIYYCDNCNKVYKVAGEGRKVKCTNCRQGLRDLSISEEDYLVLDRNAYNRTIFC